MTIEDNLYKKSIKILTDLIAFKTISGQDNNELIDYCEKILNDLEIDTFKVFDENKIRVNSISPGGVRSGQNDVFVRKYSNRVPMGRMANINEYKAAIQFLCSDDSKYMTGQNLVIDGGRSVW